MPSVYTWQEVLQNPEDFAFTSAAVNARNFHNPGTNGSGDNQISSSVEMWLGAPNTTDAMHLFTQWCWSSQVFQSMWTQGEIAFYRRGASRGERNLGSLLWMMNDIWQGTGWSTYEYSGRWKVVGYGLAAINAEVAVWPFWTPETEHLEVDILSDSLETVQGTANLTWYDYSGQSISTVSHNFTTTALNATTIYTETGLGNILPSGHNATDVWMHVTVEVVTANRTITNEQYVRARSTGKSKNPMIDHWT